MARKAMSRLSQFVRNRLAARRGRQIERDQTSSLGRPRHILITRHNIVIGWTRKARINPVDPDWLAHREELFHRFCLPSIERQTAQDFQWIMFVHAETPARFIPALERVATLIFAKGLDDAIEKLDAIIPNDGRALISTRVDNDDSIVPTFLADSRAAALKHRTGTLSAIGFSHGVRILLDRMRARPFQYVCNPFLTAVETVGPWRTIIRFNHPDIDKLMPFTSIETPEPMWAQMIHGRNAVNHTTWKEDRDDDIDPARLADLFPGLGRGAAAEAALKAQ